MEKFMVLTHPPPNLNPSSTTRVILASLRRTNSTTTRYFKPLNCAPLPQQQQLQQHQVDSGSRSIMCEPCNGKGWLLCDFCKGQKTNVKADNKRIYRRCPSCRAIGYVLCPNCKVFKCVTFPNFADGDDHSF